MRQRACHVPPDRLEPKHNPPEERLWAMYGPSVYPAAISLTGPRQQYLMGVRRAVNTLSLKEEPLFIVASYDLTLSSADVTSLPAELSHLTCGRPRILSADHENVSVFLLITY
ncbi:hypothetical protein ABVT39_025088 [Epinephelus coioides]